MTNEILDKSKSFCKNLNWTGLMMIELKYDFKNNIFYFIEVNARPWGSIYASIISGVDFPKIVMEYYDQKKLPKFIKLSKKNITLRHIRKNLKWSINKFNSSSIFCEVVIIELLLCKGNLSLLTI